VGVVTGPTVALAAKAAELRVGDLLLVTDAKGVTGFRRVDVLARDAHGRVRAKAAGAWFELDAAEQPIVGRSSQVEPPQRAFACVSPEEFYVADVREGLA